MEVEDDSKKDIQADKWRLAYILVIVINLLFAFMFYIISSVYGGN